MKIDTHTKVREVAGEHIIILQSDHTADFSTVVGLNESALFLYNSLSGREFEIDDIVSLLCAEYDVDTSTAQHDADEWVSSMRELGLLI